MARPSRIIWKLGKYSIQEDYPDSRHPFCIYKNGVAMTQSHGIYSGYKRFGSIETAKKWVEVRALPSELRAGWFKEDNHDVL
jgi:hypothetical protein